MCHVGNEDKKPVTLKTQQMLHKNYSKSSQTQQLFIPAFIQQHFSV